MFELTKFGKSYAYIKAPTINTSTKKDNLMSSHYLYSFKRDDVEVFQPTEYVHASLEDDTSRSPEEVEIFMDNEGNPLKYSVRRGQSLLYNSFKIWRQMMLLENTLLLNRLTKSSIVRIIGVEVGDMPKENIGKHLMGIKQLVEQKSALNEGLSMEEYTNPGPMENVIIIPTRNGKGALTINQIGGEVDPKQLTDLDWYNNKLFGGLKIPKQYFGWTDDSAGFSGGTSLSQYSSRFGKAVKRMQCCLCDMVTDMINLILIDTGYPRYIGRFHIKMQAPVTQEEIDRKQDLSNTLRNISDIMNTLNDVQTTSSKLKILKSLLSECLSDQDITSILQDEIDKLELEESKNQSTDNESNDTPPAPGFPLYAAKCKCVPVQAEPVHPIAPILSPAFTS